VIASVAFRNFKALRRTSLALGPFNLVIGPNGSGKTSLIEALLRLHALAQLPPLPATAPTQRSGGPVIEFHFAPPHDAIGVRLGCESELLCDFLQVQPPGAVGWPALSADLARIRGYVLNHEAIARPSDQGGGTELQSDGGNLAAVLAAMRAAHADVFAALTAEVQRILPEFVGIELTEAGAGKVALGLRLSDGALVADESVSQGTLYLLAVLALTFDPAPPAVLCIEEIDRGIHPRILREVRDALYRLSHPSSFGLARKPVQIVATTHSPYLLDLFRDHPEEVVIMQKHGTAAHFERLTDRADFAELLREGSLGDMWFSGILGGVPEEP